MRSRAVPVVLTAAERKTVKMRVRGSAAPRRRTGTGCVRRSCGLPPVVMPMSGSPPIWASGSIPCASGVAGSPSTGWAGWSTCLGPGGRGGSPRWSGQRWSRWPASCRPSAGVPLARWTGPELAAELTAQGLVNSPVSASSILRILAEHPVKPSRTLLAFVDRYDQTARPFNWKFTADDLTTLLRRIKEREQTPATTGPQPI